MPVYFKRDSRDRPPSSVCLSRLSDERPDPIRTGELNFRNSEYFSGPPDAVVRCCSYTLLILIGQIALPGCASLNGAELVSWRHRAPGKLFMRPWWAGCEDVDQRRRILLS